MITITPNQALSGSPLTDYVSIYGVSKPILTMCQWIQGWIPLSQVDPPPPVTCPGQRRPYPHIDTGLDWKPRERLNLAWYFTAGRFGDGTASGNAGDLFMNSVVLNWKVNCKLTYILQGDYAENYGLPRGVETQWYGINQYLIREINDCWSVGGRFEWFRDDYGVRVTTDGFRAPWARAIGNPGTYYAMTAGSASLPKTYTWVYQGTSANPMYSENISGAHRLPNGNTFICSGPTGRFFEVTPRG